MFRARVPVRRRDSVQAPSRAPAHLSLQPVPGTGSEARPLQPRTLSTRTSSPHLSRLSQSPDGLGIAPSRLNANHGHTPILHLLRELRVQKTTPTPPEMRFVFQ